MYFCFVSSSLTPFSYLSILIILSQLSYHICIRETLSVHSTPYSMFFSVCNDCFSVSPISGRFWTEEKEKRSKTLRHAK